MLSRLPLRFALLFALFSLLLALNPHTLAANRDADEDDDEYDVTARVARVSLLRGEVSLRRAGNSEWESAKLNLPLVEGDTLTTGHGSRLEIQIDADNFVRVGEDSVLHIITLRDEGIALSLSEGTASIRLARFEREREYFEIDAPQTTVAAELRGLYRLDVSREGRVRVTVRDGGRGRIYSDTSGFTLRENRSAELVPVADDIGADWNLFEAASFDEWDRWNDERERYLAARLRREERERYYERDVWGAEELDAYGDWAYVSSYGWVWRPHVTVINHYDNWAPYRYGHWRWCPPYGWTWVADEAWGWAPYHYGRWVYHENRWCWSPRGYGSAAHRARWRPALVAFVYVPTSYGEHVAWYPLRYGQRDPHARNWRRLTPLRGDEVRNLQRANPAYLRAVTSAPAREFGAGHWRARPASGDIAQRALTGEPVRGRLPITPADVARNGDAQGNGRFRGARISNDNAPARSLPERPTGAARRLPGIALDETLRRTRIFNNREPRSSGENGARSPARERDSFDPNSTGAVMRPARPARPARPSEERAPVIAPRTDEVSPRERRLHDDDDSGSSSTPNRWETPSPRRERPALPPRVERPTPRASEHEAQPTPRGDREERRAPERPTPREERRERPMPRPEQPGTEQPGQEQPRQEQPRPREQPRQEQPRQEQPRQERPRAEPRQGSESPRERPAPARGHGKLGTYPTSPDNE